MRGGGDVGMDAHSSPRRPKKPCSSFGGDDSKWVKSARRAAVVLQSLCRRVWPPIALASSGGGEGWRVRDGEEEEETSAGKHSAYTRCLTCETTSKK
jgi:hypothetical protein